MEKTTNFVVVQGGLNAELGPGDKGPEVAKLQQNLTEWQFNPGSIDGVYGKSTAEAVTALQRKLGTEPTGRWDAQTQRAVKTDLKSRISILRKRAEQSASDASVLSQHWQSVSDANPAMQQSGATAEAEGTDYQVADHGGNGVDFEQRPPRPNLPATLPDTTGGADMSNVIVEEPKESLFKRVLSSKLFWLGAGAGVLYLVLKPKPVVTMRGLEDDDEPDENEAGESLGEIELHQPAPAPKKRKAKKRKQKRQLRPKQAEMPVVHKPAADLSAADMVIEMLPVSEGA